MFQCTTKLQCTPDGQVRHAVGHMQTLHATGTGRVNSLVSCSVRGVIPLMCRRVRFCAVQVSIPQRMINSTMFVGHDAPRGCEGSRALGAERSLTTPKGLSSPPLLHRRLPQRSGADCHNQPCIGKREQAARAMHHVSVKLLPKQVAHGQRRICCTVWRRARSRQAAAAIVAPLVQQLRFGAQASCACSAPERLLAVV